MLKTNEGTVMLLAADFRTMIEDVDRSLLSTLKATGLLPEAFERSGLPIGQSQKVYERMSGALSKFVEGRSEVVSTVAHLRAIQKRTNCAETATGCPDGWDAVVQGSAASPERMHTDA